MTIESSWAATACTACATTGGRAARRGQRLRKGLIDGLVAGQDPEQMVAGGKALLVRRNAPGWLRKLREFDILVRNDDGTVSVRWPSFQNPEGSVTVN